MRGGGGGGERCQCRQCSVPRLRRGLHGAGASIGVLAKIESAASVDNLESILDAVDGAMVARGDLGAELPVEEVPPAALNPVSRL